MKPLSHAAPAALAELLRSTPMSPGKIEFAWNTVVGSAIARATAIRLEGDVLLVDTASGQWAREIARSAPLIVTRMQAFLGAHALTAIHVRPPSSDVKPHRRRGRSIDPTGRTKAGGGRA